MCARHRKPKTEKDTRNVACSDETVSIETLPYPVVYYPAHYGAFTAFKPDAECKSYTFCECSRPALYNYVRLLKASPAEEQETCMHSRKLVDMREFPISFLLQDSSKDLDEFYDSLIFKPGLCHVCRKEIPSYAYCADMYGSKLEQNYGWYKKQDTFKRGIYNSPADGASRYIAADGDIVFFDPSNPPDFLPAISDDVRTRLGTGDKWKNETALYNTVLSLYPKLTAVRHYRASWLENLELDTRNLSHRKLFLAAYLDMPESRSSISKLNIKDDSTMAEFKTDNGSPNMNTIDQIWESHGQKEHIEIFEKETSAASALKRITSVFHPLKTEALAQIMCLQTWKLLLHRQGQNIHNL